MPEFTADLRDVRFVLFEQLQLDKLLGLDKYSEFSAEDFDMMLTEAYKIAKDVMWPLNEVGDTQKAVWNDNAVTMPEGFKAAWDTMRESGFLALTMNPEYGGMGLPGTMGQAINDLFVGANPALSLTPLLTTGSAHLIEAFGTDELKNTYVEKMYTGEWAGTMCLTEPQAGTDVGASKTKAVPNGDGSYNISGTKIFISSGEHNLTDNIIHAVLARVEGDPAGTKGITLFAVPKYRVNPDGSLGEFNDVKCVGIEHKMGIHASPTCVMAFGENGKCVGWPIGELRQGMRNMFQMMNEARIGVGLQGSATANAAYQMALAYAKERKQGPHITRFKDATAPRVEIVEHPDVKRMLLEQKALAEGCRALVLKAAYYEDLSQHGSTPEEREKYEAFVQVLTPIVKAYCTDMAFKVTELAMQTHGGYGYLKEYGVEQMMRDVKIASIYEGTNGVQAMDLVGRKLTMKRGAYLMSLMRSINKFIDAYADLPELRQEMNWLAEARDAVNEVSMHFAMSGQNDPTLPLLNAYPYLMLFGDLLIGQLLLEQAVIAQDKLGSIAASKKVSPKRKPELYALLEENDEARFYYGKIKAAKFFANTYLPLAKGRSEAIRSQDRSPLEMVF